MLRALPAVSRPGISLASLRLHIAVVWQIAAVVAPFIVAAGVSSLTNDTWWAIKMGRLSVAAGHPMLDVVLAHTPVVEHATNGQWLGQVVLYAVYAGFGETGVRVLAGVVVAAAFGLLLAVARAGGAGPRPAAGAVLLGVLLASSNVAPRAQLFALFLFALTYTLLCLRDRVSGWLWALPALFALWANMHGSFVLGPGLLGLLALGDGLAAMARPGERPERQRRVLAVARRYLPLLVAGCAATVVNPLGWGLYGYVGTLMGHPFMGYVEEWRPPSLSEPTGLAFAAVGTVLGFVMVTSRRRPTIGEALLVLVFGVLALTSQRNVVWAGMVAVPIGARLASASRLGGWATGGRAIGEWVVGRGWWAGGVSRWLVRRLRARSGRSTPARPPARLTNTVLAGMLILLGAFAPVWRPLLAQGVQVQPEAAEIAPREAADFLAGLPASHRLFHYQPWTGYLAWRAWPSQLPFLDVRVEAHPVEVWLDYLAVDAAREDWEVILDRYGVDCLVLQRTGQARLARAAEATGRWVRIYEDDVAVILTQRERLVSGLGRGIADRRET